MNILEKDLEEIISTTPTSKLNEKGLFLNGVCYRQTQLGNYGKSDLIYISKEYEPYDFNGKIKYRPFLKVQICELKKDKAGISAFFQAIRYAKGVKRYFTLRGFDNFIIEIVLIAPKIDTTSDYIFLTDLVSSDEFGFICKVSNYSVNYGFDGVIFRREYDYSVVEENFKTLK